MKLAAVAVIVVTAAAVRRTSTALPSHNGAVRCSTVQYGAGDKQQWPGVLAPHCRHADKDKGRSGYVSVSSVPSKYIYSFSWFI